MNKKLLVILLIFLAVGVGVLNFQGKNVPKSPNEKAVKEFKATLTIGEKSFDVSQFIGKSALEATDWVASTAKSGKGKSAFVTEINGQKADSNKREFWEFLINGKSSDVGAGSYTVQNGDNLKWQLSLY